MSRFSGKRVAYAESPRYIHIEIDLDEVLRGLARLGTTELEQFVEKVMALQAQRRAPSLPKDETELLQQINRGLPANVRQRYDVLNANYDETITPQERRIADVN